MEEIRKTEQRTDEQLFVTLRKNKKRRKIRLLLTAAGITLAILLALGFAVRMLRARVDEKYNAGNSDVLSYTASTGAISTTVTGTGILEDLDPEELILPADVTVDEIVVNVNDHVRRGDIIAKLDMSSVLSTMSKVQAELDEYDQKLDDASDAAAGKAVLAGVSGRVKQIYCAEGDSVADCMYRSGALILLSADGYLAGRLPADELQSGDSLTARRNDGSEVLAFVDSVEDGNAEILLDDEKVLDGEKVEILDENGTLLGTCIVQIRNPLRVTAYAGNIRRVNVSVGDRVSAATEVITLTDTEYSANYEAILRQREEKEETLRKLLSLYHDGALLSPIEGTVCAVEEQEESQTSVYQQTPEEQKIASVSDDREMVVTVNVDESDILSLQEGQSVDLTVASVSDDPFEGTLREIDKKAQSDSGITNYRAKIVVKKQPGMLPGMSAKARIRIQGVENAVIIPLDALHQTSAFSYVYTSYDPEAGEYGGRVEVTAGLSNANDVEIISGLQPGDVVYYTERRKSDFWGFGGFGGMSGWSQADSYEGYDMEGLPPQGYGGPVG